MAERSPIQTAAILICLTGKRGDNLPRQRGGEGGGEQEGGREVENNKERESESKGRRVEQNSDKGLDRESQKKKERNRERGGKESVIFDYGSRLRVCPKAKDCQPANRGGRCVGVSVCVCESMRACVGHCYQHIIYAEYTCLCVSVCVCLHYDFWMSVTVVWA